MRGLCQWVFVVLALVAGLARGYAQEAPTVGAPVGGLTDEQYSRLRGDIENLIAFHNALKSRIEATESEVQQLRQHVAENKVDPSRFASAAEVKALARDVQELAKKVREIDAKRQADRELILRQMRADKEQILRELAREMTQLSAPFSSKSTSKSTGKTPGKKTATPAKAGAASKTKKRTP